MQVSFYHLQTKPLERALPELLEKILQKDLRVVVRAKDEMQVEELDVLLWTYRPDSFLPHGTQSGGHEEIQSVWLTEKDENPNASQVYLTVSGALPENMDAYDKVLDMFDGSDADAVKAARSRWKDLQSRGVDLIYYQQSETGQWQQKANSKKS